MVKRIIINALIACGLLLCTYQVYSQIQPQNNKEALQIKGDFKYINTYYKANPKGLNNFMEAAKINPDVKADLNTQLKAIKSRDLSAKIALYSGFAIGSGILLNEIISVKDGESVNSNTLYAGLGVWAVGGILNLAIRPKKKHYIKFIDTFNKIETDHKIELQGARSNSNQMQLGIAINF